MCRRPNGWIKRRYPSGRRRAGVCARWMWSSLGRVQYIVTTVVVVVVVSRSDKHKQIIKNNNGQYIIDISIREEGDKEES